MFQYIMRKSTHMAIFMAGMEKRCAKELHQHRIQEIVGEQLRILLASNIFVLKCLWLYVQGHVMLKKKMSEKSTIFKGESL